MKRKLLTLFLLLGFVVFTNSCKPTVSLGGSVDVLPPQDCKIIYPALGANPISGSFIITGEASDDDSIASVSAVFENNETKVKTAVYNAELTPMGAGKTSWKIEVKNDSTGIREGHPLVKEYPIVDGEYTVFVTIEDKSGKKTVINRSYKIDNTPPVFIVSRPSIVTAGDDRFSGDKYGAVFYVDGEAGEENTVEDLGLEVPNANINIVKKFVGKTIKVDIAADGPSDSLYGLQVQHKDKNIQAKLFLTDNARKFANGEPAGAGNKSGWYYLKDEIYADIMGKGFTADVINDYFAGKKYSASKEKDELLKRLYADNDADAKRVRDLLFSKRIMMDGSEEKFSAFTLDPGKSPGFKVLNAKILDRDISDIGKVSSVLYSDTSAASLLLELIRNKDRTPLLSGFNLETYKKSGLSVKLYRNKDADNININEQFKNLKEFKIDNLEVAGSLNFADLTQDDLDNKVIVPDNGGLKIKFALPKTEGYYLIKVEGKDVDGNDYAPYDENNSAMSGAYIFNLLSQGNGPRIRPIRPSGFKNNNFEITVNITGLNGGKAYFRLGSPAGADPSLDKELTLDTSDINHIRYKGTVVLSGMADGTNTIHFYAVDKKGKFDRADTDFEVDKTAPAITVTNPDRTHPQAGKIKVTGTIFDAGAGVNEHKTMYIIGQQTSEPTIDTPLHSVTNNINHWRLMTNSTSGSWNFEVDLSDILSTQYGVQEGSYYRIPFYVLTEDKLGNKKVYTDNFLFDPDGKRPIIEVLSPQAGTRLGGTIQIFGTANVAIGGPGDVGEVYIQFSKSGNFNDAADGTFGGTGSIPAKNWYNGGDGQAIPGTASGGANWRITINSDKAFDPTSGSSHDVYFRVRAKNKDNTTLGGWSTPVKIIVDKDAPTIGSPNAVKVGTNDYLPNMWVKNGEILKGSLNDASGLKSVEIKSSGFGSGINYNLDTAKANGWITDAGSGNYELNIPFNFSNLSASATSAGTFSITVRIVENTQHNLSAEQTFTFRFDRINPIGDYGKEKHLPGVGDFSANSFVNSTLAGLLSHAPTNYKILIKNTIVSVTRVSGNSIEFSPSITAGTYNYIVYEPVSLIYADMADNKWKIQGVANDDGAGIEKVEAWIEVNGTATAHTVIDDSYSNPADKIKRAIDGQVIWEGGIKLDNVADGKGVLKYKITDRSGNVYEGTKGGILVKNKPVQIQKLVFKTDLSGNGNYEADEMVTIENFGQLNNDKDFRGITNVASNFTFKNPTKSELVVTLKGGYGTNATVSLNKDSIDGANIISSPAAIPASGEYTVTLDLSNKLNIGDHTNKALFLKVTDSSFNSSWHAQADITVGLEVTDNLKPTGVIVPFFYNSDKTMLTGTAEEKLSSVKYESGKPAGHIEISGISSLGNTYPCVSGKVILRGIAYDNIRLKKLELSGAGISAVSNEFTNGAWSTATPLKVVKNKFSNTGHYVEWEYEWNTGTPGLTQTVMLKVTDDAGKNNDGTNAEPAVKPGTRISEDDDALILHTDDKAVAGQFIRLTDENEKSYLVQINSVEASKIKWSNTDIPQTINKYFLYKKDSNNAELKVNVVPYITKVTTKLSGGSSLHPSTVNRSALGVYPVSRVDNGTGFKNETITVEGFNIAPGANNIFTVSDKGKNINDAGTGFETSTVQIPNSNVSVVNGKYTVNLQALTKSGYLSYAAKVGTKYIPAVNNINLNTKEYNKEPNNRNNNILNDDRYIKLLDVYKVQGLGDLRQLDFAVYENTLNFSAGYIDKYFSVFQNISGTSATAKNLRYSYTRYFDNCIAYNDSGTVFTLSACGDTQGSTHDSGFGGGPAKFGLIKGIPSTIQNEYNQAAADTLFLESNYNGSAFNNLNRFQWPDMTVKGTDGASKGYISYYDSTQKLVKFRYFESVSTTTGYTKNTANLGGTTLFMKGGSGSHIEQAVPEYEKDSKKYHQGFAAIAGADSNSPYSAVGVTSDGTTMVVWYDAVAGALKLKYNTKPAESFSGYQAFQTNPAEGTISFKIAVDGTPAKNVSLRANTVSSVGTFEHEFAYQLNKVLSENGYGAYAEYDPILTKVVVRSMQTGSGSSIEITELKSNGVASGSTATAVPGTGVKWIEKVIDTDQAGKNPSLTVDSKNGLHIAYNATGSGDLRYAYIPKVTESNVFVSTVDSYQQTGAYTDIAVKEVTEGGKIYIVPYISYFTMSLADTRYSVKLASLKDRLIPKTGNHSFNNNAHGAVDELFTGKWEVMHIPSGEIPVQYRVNVEVAQNGSVYLAYQGDKIEYVKVE